MKGTRILKGEKSIVRIGNLEIGGENEPVLIAGSCSVESREQIVELAMALKEVGVNVLRGGTFKPRTSPYDFQGLGIDGLKYLREAGNKAGLYIITELLDIDNIEAVIKYVDIIQIGSRNMYNYPLLKAVGRVGKPVLLKRGISATLQEWIMAAEYIAMCGNRDIILCERGIRTFNDYTRNTLDLAAVPIMKKETGLPVIVDPSHGTGVRELIAPMSAAALACGADGLMIETHMNPEAALSDGYQSINLQEYKKIREGIFNYRYPKFII